MKRVHYAWIVAAVTFVALMGAAGFRATPGVLIVPLEHEFGWNRAIISFAVFINRTPSRHTDTLPPLAPDQASWAYELP